MKIRSCRFIFLYRTFLFNMVKFETDDISLNKIVKALNIKKRSNRYEYIYDEAIREINAYYKDDLCDFKGNKCIAQRRNNSDRINGCCYGCKLVTAKGCPSENFACKLIYCKDALGNMTPLKMRNIKILKCLPISKRIILMGDFFVDRERILADLKYNVFIYSFLVIFRTLKKN